MKPDEKLRDSDIRVIDTNYLRPRFVASHLLISEGEAAFIDVGTSLSHDYLIKGLKEARLTTESVKYIILTHIHLDHAGGAGALMRSCPRATILVHPKGAKHIIDPERLVQASIEIYGAQQFARLYGEVLAVPEKRVTSVEDGFVLDFNGRLLRFLDTPGHARHHFSIWDPKSGGIFTGDTLGMAYPELQDPDKPPFMVPTTSPTAFEPDRLEQSIRRLMELQPERFYLAHFGPVAAHHDSVNRLVELIRRHADLGRHETDPDRLARQVRDVVFEAYCRYANGQADSNMFDEIMANDIKLNGAGIAVYASRLRASRSK